MADMQVLIQQIMSDAGFRKEIAADPVAALKKRGYDATPELVQTFSGMDESALLELASNYSNDKAAC